MTMPPPPPPCIYKQNEQNGQNARIYPAMSKDKHKSSTSSLCMVRSITTAVRKLVMKKKSKQNGRI